MKKLHLDFETRSRLDLNKVGVWTYAAHPSTDVLCMGISLPKNEPTVWDAEEVRNGKQFGSCPEFQGTVSAHNAHFEYAIYNLILHKRYGWPAMWEPSRWSCTMARALACGLPSSLDELGRVLKIKTPKDLDGRKLMLQMCRPRKDGTFNENLKDLARLYEYNANDVRAEMEVDALLPELQECERKVWEHDLTMNRRGIQIDLDFARAAAKTSEIVKDELSARLENITGGAVKAVTQVQGIKDYLKKQGVSLPIKHRRGESVESIDKVGLVKMLLDPAVDPHCRQVIRLRQQGGKSTSVAKYKQVLEMVGEDGRVRGTIQYHAAHTGRDGGRLLQPQNIPSGFEDADIQLRAVDLVKRESPSMFLLEYGDNAMDALSDALRGLIVAAPGKELFVADYSAIEARGVFWFADDHVALDCYARGESPYVQMANYIFKRDDITKKGDPKEYKIGKMVILGCGFGMSWVKFRDSVFIETAKRGDPLVLSDELAKAAVKGYRDLHSPVVRLWNETADAAMKAIQNPGERFTCAGGKIMYAMSNDRRFLICRLPSGRYLWYYHPSVKPLTTHWCPKGHGRLEVEKEMCFCPECGSSHIASDIRRTKDEIHYWGKNPITKVWCELKTYGGALVENYVQATARDLMMNGRLKVGAAGFPVVLPVHDEVIAEVLKGTKSFDEYLRILCDKPGWAEGYPVAAEGWTADRYRK